ncbi:MAG: histidinol-phosphate transaminase [Bacillota bacterium]|nr:histidinol-phosphate transaminase [Bacillota bacterium]
MRKTAKRLCLENINPYVPGKPIEEVERELGLSDVVKMASNENPLGPSPLALKAITDYLHRISLYPDGNGYYLKQALAKHLGLGEKNIVLGNGADELIILVGVAYLNPGDEIIMAQPSFSEYDFSARLMDAVPVCVPCKDFRHDLQAIAAAITEKTKIIYICNPNNPTGTIVTQEEVEKFLEKMPPEILIVFDEAYYEFVDDQTYAKSIDFLKKGLNILILRTFSKIFGLAGLRVGYGLAAEQVISDLNTVREPFNVNSLAQVAARAALEDLEHIEAVKDVNRKGKEFLAAEFTRMGLFHIPTEANFIFVEVGVDSKELFQMMLRKGVIVRTGDIFGYPKFIRVTIDTEDHNRRFIKALEECLKELA